VTRLLAIPNVSEGRDEAAIEAIGRAFGPGLLDVHRDPDHHRSVFTLTGPPQELSRQVLAGAREAVARVDVSAHRGLHPRVGALDVAPIVHLDPRDRGAACAEALVLGDLLAEELELPVFLYGALSGDRTRAQLRRGGPTGLAARIEQREIAPDFGPPRLHPTAGAVLVAARAPLVAFNLELAAPAAVEDAQRIAARIREGGEEGLEGVRAIGLWLQRAGVAQVSTNVEDHLAAPLAALLGAVSRHARVTATELVGLAPRAAFRDFPEDMPVRHRRLLEDVLANFVPPP
jgi:glutamate formiminotransferase / 5-formyltetrahydrofolate cyclo-ligase